MRYDEFRELNTEIVPILVDKKENALKMEIRYAKEKFSILYDKNNQVAKQLGQEFKILKLGRMPGLLYVDQNSIIRFAYYGKSMKDIPKNKDVLERIKKCNLEQ